MIVRLGCILFSSNVFHILKNKYKYRKKERKNSQLLALKFISLDLFTNDPGDRDSIPGRIIAKTQKIVFDASLLDTQYYKVRIKGKWNNAAIGVASSLTPW